MAEMIPESILKVHSATSGEKKIFKILREALQPDDEHYVWYDTPVLGRYSDFVIFSQDFGIIVLEVKDWSKNRFKSFNPRTFRGNFYNENEEVEALNPLQQARNYVNKIRNLIKKNTSLTQTEGEYVGNIRFPIGKCIAFTNMSRKEANDLGLINDS
ncbi:nuclease-related domain-containing protein, partial [Acinetobacter seifertii]|uniref:nuclease-related domain-containing protein n=1 Tax=Acinetobacter seifertii TaxID=1530123 RepID=UPI00148F0EBD